jgi:hypothetical protein
VPVDAQIKRTEVYRRPDGEFKIRIPRLIGENEGFLRKYLFFDHTLPMMLGPNKIEGASGAF